MNGTLKNLAITITMMLIASSITFFLTRPEMEIEEQSEQIDKTSLDFAFEDGVEFTEARFLKVLPELAYDKDRSIYSLSGEVTSVEETKITFALNSPIYPLDPIELDERTVLISQNVEITKRFERNQEQFEKELQEFELSFENRNENNFQDIDPPERYVNEIIDILEIQVGDRIRVFSESDIHFEKEITATKIKIN